VQDKTVVFFVFGNAQQVVLEVIIQDLALADGSADPYVAQPSSPTT
jgi:hypothetical protein